MAPNEIKVEELINDIKNNTAKELSELAHTIEENNVIIPTNKEYRRAKRAYKRMRKRHRKQLIKLVKVDRPWDYEYIFILLEAKLRQMVDYFSQDYNILQTEESRNKILTGLCGALHTLHLRNDGYDDNYHKQVTAALKTIAENYGWWWD